MCCTDQPRQRMIPDRGVMQRPTYSVPFGRLLAAAVVILFCTAGAAEAREQEEHAAEETPLIRHVVIEAATDQTPRSDTASVAELSHGRLMVVYHKYERGKHSGHDHGICRIWSKVSNDGGRSWQHPRMLVDVAEGDMNVQAPALLRLKSGPILLICLRAHQGGGSSTMCLFSSEDEGRSFSPLEPVWTRSPSQSRPHTKKLV